MNESETEREPILKSDKGDMPDSLKNRYKDDSKEKEKYRILEVENKAKEEAEKKDKKKKRAGRTMDIVILSTIMIIVITVIIGCILYIIKKDDNSFQDLFISKVSNVNSFHQIVVKPGVDFGDYKYHVLTNGLKFVSIEPNDSEEKYVYVCKLIS